MPAHSKKSPATIKKLVALHENGASAREIAEQLHIASRTVSSWMRELGLEPNGGSGKRSSRKRKKPTKDDQTAAAIAAEVQADMDRGITGIGTLRERLAVLRKAVKDAHPAFIKGHLNATQYEKLVNLETRLARELAAAEATSSPSSGKTSVSDPFTLEAAALVTAKFRLLIEKAERVARER